MRLRMLLSDWRTTPGSLDLVFYRSSTSLRALQACDAGMNWYSFSRGEVKVVGNVTEPPLFSIRLIAT